MKKILLFFIAVFIAVGSFAQVISRGPYFSKSYGITAGINYQTIFGSPFAPTYSSGFIGGGYIEYRKGIRGFRIEALLGDAGIQTSRPLGYFKPVGAPLDYDSVSKGSFSMLYLHIPLLAEFKFYRKIFFVIGPEIEQQLTITDNSGVFKQDYPKSSIGNIFRSSSLAIDLGFEGTLRKKVSVGVRFSKGLTDINGTTIVKALDNFQIWHVQATMSFRFSADY
jgi:Outer membrane protein beta-barrel domain